MVFALESNPATSCRQLCLHARQTRQRAPFSCGLYTQKKTRRRCNQECPCCCALTVATPQPLLHQPAVHDSQPFSFSTYRDDGALSEVSIADCLFQEASDRQTEVNQTEYQASHRSKNSSTKSSAAAPRAVQVNYSASIAQLCVKYRSLQNLSRLEYKHTKPKGCYTFLTVLVCPV